MIKWIKQFFCIHDMQRLDNDPMPSVKKGEMVSMIRLHRCKKCSVEYMIGSGWHI